MKELVEFVTRFTQRGDCTCGRCIDRKDSPEQPEGHTADLIFFKVSAINNPDAGELRRLVEGNKAGEFCNIDMFDGKEHSYMEIGGWIGSQDLALQLMGLGTVLGLWDLWSPVTILKLPPDSELAKDLAMNGFLSIKAKKST